MSTETATQPKEAGNQGSSASGNELTGKFVFMEKVGDIPVVNAAKEYGTAAYNSVKQMNPIANFALSKAESTLLFFALSAKPYLEKIQPQAKIVDDIACRTLEVVESKVPYILMTPEELVGEARKICSSSVDTGLQKVEDIKSMGNEAVSSVKNYGLQKAKDCLNSTEDMVERYLPPAFGENSKEATEQSESISQRATQLTNKVTKRVFDHGVKQFIGIQELSQKSIAQLAMTVELLQQVKENYAGKSVQECFDEAKLKASWIWDELNKEPAKAEEAEKSLEQRLLSLARRLTSTLVHTYHSTTLPLTGLPQACLDGVHSASAYAAELFNQFDQATNAGEVASIILQRTRSTIAVLDGVVKTMLDSAKENENIEMEDLSGNAEAT